MVTPASAVAFAVSILARCESVQSEGHAHHPTIGELQALARESAYYAPKASSWIGFELPTWLPWVVSHRETCIHNQARNCDGGTPSNRSAGYYSIGADAWEEAGRALNYTYWVAPPLAFYEALESRTGPFTLGETARDRWAKLTCELIVAHPKTQVRVFYRIMAKLAKRHQGDLPKMLASYGPESDLSYPDSARKIADRYFPGEWPPHGRLRRIR